LSVTRINFRWKGVLFTPGGGYPPIQRYVDERASVWWNVISTRNCSEDVISMKVPA